MLQKQNNELIVHENQVISGLQQIQAKAKLPKLELPKFKGDVTKWNSWDSFKSAFHERRDCLELIAKFNRLNSLLENSAKRSIEGLCLTDSNNDSAVEILNERFGNPQLTNYLWAYG